MAPPDDVKEKDFRSHQRINTERCHWRRAHQGGVDEAVRGGPGLGRDEAVEGELLLGAVDGGDVVGGVALLGVGVHLHRPVAVLWQEGVDGDGLGFDPGLRGEGV